MNAMKLILGLVLIAAAVASFILLSNATVKYIVSVILAIVGIWVLLASFKGDSSMGASNMAAPAARPAMPGQAIPAQ